jgi:hypothetical protein
MYEILVKFLKYHHFMESYYNIRFFLNQMVSFIYSTIYEVH